MSNMTKLHKLRLTTLIIAALMAGCNDQAFQDLDLNPQAVNQIDLNFMFTPILLQLSTGSVNRAYHYSTTQFFSMVIQQVATSNEFPGDKYLHDVRVADAVFDFSYETLRNISEILRQTGPGGYDEGNKNNMRQATRILRAFMLQRITDHYGNIPYFEAGQALAEESIIFPRYDHQRLIYSDLLKELEEATGMLVESTLDEGFGAADFVYNGDINKWRKLGYSIMLRIAMRASNVDPDLADTYVAKAIAGGVIISNEDNFVAAHDLGPDRWENQNGLSRSVIPGDGNGPTFISKTLIDFLKGADANSLADDDPRLMIISGGIADWPSPDEWVLYPGGDDPLNQKGMPNGYDALGLEEIEGSPVDKDATYSKINPKFFQLDEPHMLLNAAEVEFKLAEAAERGIGGVTDAKEHYEAGVKLAMQMYTLYDPSLVVTDEQVANYLATYPYGSKDPLEMIGEQLWVSLFLNWMEAFNAYRRTEYPVLVPTNYPGNVTGGTIPQRIRYPDRELAANPNFLDGSTQPDTYTTRVWWAGGD